MSDDASCMSNYLSCFVFFVFYIVQTRQALAAISVIKFATQLMTAFFFKVTAFSVNYKKK